MKSIKRIILIFSIVTGLSLAVSAQKNDKKPPPKGRPPVVTPQQKDPPKENPSDKKGPRRPAFELVWTRAEMDEIG